MRGSGLARVGDAAGFLIAFATQPDNVAYDGAGRNSPVRPGAARPHRDAGRRYLQHDDRGAQRRHRRDRRRADSWDELVADAAVLFRAATATSETSPEALLWRLAGARARPQTCLSIYLDRYPKGPHAADVRALLAEDRTAAKPQAAVGARR